MTHATLQGVERVADPPPGPGARMPRAERRAQLLRLAEDLFARAGYHHVSMDDVAEAAGISKPILYRHFVSKIDLYLCVVDVQGALLVAAVRRGLLRMRDDSANAGADHAATGAGGEHLVDAVVDAYVEYAREAGVSASLLFESDVMRNPEVRARVLAPHETVAEEFAAALEPLTGLDRARALVVARTCTGIARSAAAEVDRRTTSDAQELVPRLAWNGLRDMVGTGQRGTAGADPRESVPESPGGTLDGASGVPAAPTANAAPAIGQGAASDTV